MHLRQGMGHLHLAMDPHHLATPCLRMAMVRRLAMGRRRQAILHPLVRQEPRHQGGTRASKGDGKGAKDKGGDPKKRLEQWLRVNTGWIGVWLEGVDPPRIQAATPNVTALMFVNLQPKKEGGDDFGFMLTTSRSTTKKKDREKECAVDLMDILDRMPTDKMEAWCQMKAEPTEATEKESGGEKSAEPDLAKLTEQVQKKVQKVTLDMPDSLSHVMVAAILWPERREAWHRSRANGAG